MATSEDIARSILAAVDIKSSVGTAMAARWVKERYKELVGRVQFRHLRERHSIYVPSPYITGTITVTAGSNVATGSGTAFTLAHEGWYFRAANVWLQVMHVDTVGQTLTFESPYSEVSGSGLSYYLVMRNIPVPRGVRWIGEITHPRRRKRLRQRSETYLDYRHPSRMLVGPFPYCWAESPASRGIQSVGTSSVSLDKVTTDKRKFVEVYPPSNQAEQYDLTGWTIPQTWDDDEPLPPEIDEYVLREGVLVDYYRSRMGDELQKDVPNTQLIELLMNQAARQQTLWNQSIQAAIIADRTMQDVEVTVGSGLDEWDYAEEDIITARDQVYSQWPN